jgi:hypothetical protein
MTDAIQRAIQRAIERAIDELRTAFPPHPLETESVFAEWGVSYTDGTSYKAEARGKRWDELSPRFLERHHDALLFLGPDAVVEAIPAYLAVALQRAPELDMLPAFLIGVLARRADPERFDARFGRLTPAQREAIAHALEAWEGSLEDSHRRRSITEALESYWRTTRSG